MPDFGPVEPPASAYRFDLTTAEPGEDLLASGGDLAPGTLLAAYRAGLFPMGLGRNGKGPVGWWSPDPRGVLLADRLRVSRSLGKAARRLETTVDHAFGEVVAACADPSRSGRWITRDVAEAYGRLHTLGWAHSVECWSGGQLVGGLYGVAIGGLFAGESMFHRQTDASKVALVRLTEVIWADGDPRRLIDVQWRTDHLATLGVVSIPRPEYLARLEQARELALPPRWAGPSA